LALGVFAFVPTAEIYVGAVAVFGKHVGEFCIGLVVGMHKLVKLFLGWDVSLFTHSSEDDFS